MHLFAGVALQGVAEQVERDFGDGQVVAQRVSGEADDPGVERGQGLQVCQGLFQLRFGPERAAATASLGVDICGFPPPQETCRHSFRVAFNMFAVHTLP
jgi:hypothetical protein